MNPLARIVALVRANPALAIAGAGIGGVLVLPLLNRGEPAADETAAAEPAAAVYGPGYATALTTGAGGGLESDALASQINEGNNFLLGQLGELREQIALPRTGTKPAVPVAAGRGGSTPVRRPLPGAPGARLAVARRIGALRPVKRLSSAEISTILQIYGVPRAKPPASALVSADALVKWIRTRKGRAGA